MNKAIKYRIYPNLEQQAMFIKTFGCCRKVYNLMLADKIKSYEETKSFGSQTPAMYKIDYPYLKEIVLLFVMFNLIYNKRLLIVLIKRERSRPAFLNLNR